MNKMICLVFVLAIVLSGCAATKDLAGIQVKPLSAGDVQITSQSAVGILIFGMVVIIAQIIAMVRIAKWITRDRKGGAK